MTEISRRTFIQLSVLATGAATSLAGCKNEGIWKEEATGQYGGMSNKAYPYVNQPDGTIDGVPAYFATTCQMCSAGCGIYVRTLGGRANKIEGNPYHPVSGGKSCLRGQLALQHLYNPDRLMRPMQRSRRSDDLSQTDWETVMTRTADALQSARGKTAILIDGATIARSPTKMSTLQRLSSALDAELLSFSLVDDAPWRAAALAHYGRNQLPDYRLDLADLVVSFGGNFLETWPSPVYYGRLFGEFRQGTRRMAGSHGRFIYVGPRLSMTASKADVWLPCRAGTESVVALGVLGELGGNGVPASVASEISGLSVDQIVDLASKFRQANAKAVAIGGDGLFAARSVTDAFIDVERLNIQTKSECVAFGSSLLEAPSPPGGFRAIQQLAQRMGAGEIAALMIVGSVNPSFALPQTINWSRAAAKVPFIVSVASFLDETAEAADVALASRSFLEEWSDHVPAVLPSDFALASMNQPVIDPSYITHRFALDSNGQPLPMMDTRETVDILSDLSNRLGALPAVGNSRDNVRRLWAPIGSADLASSDIDNDVRWTEAVSSGGRWNALEESVPKPASAKPPGRPVLQQAPGPTDGSFQLQLFPHIFYDDGRNANLGWAQEMPDPITAAVWNSWVEINDGRAHRLGIRTGDLVRLTSGSGYIDVQAVPSPAIHPEVVAMPIGQGHTGYGRNAAGVGANPLAIVDVVIDPVTGAQAFSATSVKVTKIADAVSGYHTDLGTLVLVQDRPHGAEPAAVKDLIHETAKEWKGGEGAAPSSPSHSRKARPVL